MQVKNNLNISITARMTLSKTLMSLIFIFVLLMFTVALMGCQAAVSTTNPNAPKVYFNGLYQCLETDFSKYLRFYPDGEVISVSTIKNAELKKIARWFNKSHRLSSKGTYTVKGHNISFSVVSSLGTLDFEGTINKDTLSPNVYSHINDVRGFQFYTFVPLSFEIDHKYLDELRASSKAKNPTPTDGATDVTCPLIKWKPGDRSSGFLYNVYFGKSPELSEADLIYSYINDTGCYVTEFERGKTYYWRIDIFESDFVTVHKGDVWRFTVKSN